MSIADIHGYGGVGGCTGGHAWQHWSAGNWTTLLNDDPVLDFFQE